MFLSLLASDLSILQPLSLIFLASDLSICILHKIVFVILFFGSMVCLFSNSLQPTHLKMLGLYFNHYFLRMVEAIGKGHFDAALETGTNLPPLLPHCFHLLELDNSMMCPYELSI